MIIVYGDQEGQGVKHKVSLNTEKENLTEL